MKKTHYPKFLRFFDQKKFDVKNNSLISNIRKINDASKKIWKSSCFINFPANDDGGELSVDRLFDDFNARLDGDLVPLAYSMKGCCEIFSKKNGSLRNFEFLDVVDAYFRKGCEIIKNNKEIFLGAHPINAWHPFLRVIFLFKLDEVIEECRTTGVKKLASAFEKTSLASKEAIEDRVLYLIQRESKILTLRFDVIAINLTRYHCEISLMKALNELNLQVAGGMLMAISVIFPRNCFDLRSLNGCIGHACTFISLNKFSGKEEKIFGDLMNGLNDLENRELSLRFIDKGETDSVKKSLVGIKKFRDKDLNNELNDFCEFMTLERSILKPLIIDIPKGNLKTLNNIKIKTF